MHRVFVVLWFTSCTAQRVELNFNKDWLFFQGELPWTCATPESLSDFPINLTGSFINNLAPAPAGNASPEDCANQRGCAGCQAWQWCNNSLCAQQASAPCPPNVSWPHDYTNLQCDGLTSASASSATECADACCSSSECDIYQWCNASTCSPEYSCWIGRVNPSTCSPIAGWVSRARDLPVAAACYVGLLADYGPGAWSVRR